MNFIGLSYLLVYVGAVSILFLFILMLINIRVSELLSPNYNTITLAIIIGIAFNFSFNNVIPSSLIDYKDSLIKYIGEML
jgi:NADH-ubiquinone oxidoreductase chain 6